MNTLVAVLIGALLAYIAYLLLAWILPVGPLPAIGAIVVFLVYVFGGDRIRVR